MIVDRNKSVRGNPLRMHMIDCGLTVELGERDHMNLTKILGSLIKRDGYGAGALMVDTAKKCQATELDVEMFCKGMQKICDDDEENVSFYYTKLLYACVSSNSLFTMILTIHSISLSLSLSLNALSNIRTFLKVLGTTSLTFVTWHVSIR